MTQTSFESLLIKESENKEETKQNEGMTKNSPNTEN